MTADRLDGLTTVVINYGLPDLTVRCVRALVGDGVRPERIVIVDNGSTDDSVERLRGTFPECPFVALEENVGYARAANAGAAALDGTHYLIMNNDAFVHIPGSVAALVDALEADPERGIVVPRVRNDDMTLQRTVKPLDTPAVALVRASGLSRFVPNRFQPRWSTHWNHDRSPRDRRGGRPVLRSPWEAPGRPSAATTRGSGCTPRTRTCAGASGSSAGTTWFTVDGRVRPPRTRHERPPLDESGPCHPRRPLRGGAPARAARPAGRAGSAILFIVGGLGARWALMSACGAIGRARRPSGRRSPPTPAGSARG